MSWFGPDSVGRTDWKPLTAEERKKIYIQQLVIGPGVYFASLSSAAAAQSSNRPPEWGQGAKGYFHRVGDNLARASIVTSVSHGVAAITRQEVRYVRCDCSGFWPRFGSALAQNFVIYNNAGKLSPNYGRMAGAVSSEVISSYWWPERTRSPSSILRGISLQFSFNTGFNVLREFSPEIRRVFKKR